MTSKWVMVAAAAAILGLAGMSGPALAANPAACAGCHGADGQGVGPNPKIAGMTKAAFTSAMEAYRSGAKTHPVMNAVSKNLSDSDISQLADYFGSK